MTLKRGFDLVVAVLGLAALTPVMLLFALVIRIDSPGPVLFCQERVGLRGRRFRILKFRTMRHEKAGIASEVTVAGDARITRTGRVLRAWKLDELPQLLNVIIGNMSLVGPRPEVSKYVSLYPAAMREIVLSVRPGITDLAAIEFVNESAILAAAPDPEAAYVGSVLPRKLALQKKYVERRSFWLDLRLIMRTVTTLVFPRR